MDDKKLQHFVPLHSPKKVGKFVQVYIKNRRDQEEPYLLTGEESRTHSSMLEETLDELGIFHRKSAKTKKVSLRGKRYRQVGKGAIFTQNYKIYELSSMGETHMPDEQHAEDMTPYLPDGIGLIILKI